MTKILKFPPIKEIKELKERKSTAKLQLENFIEHTIFKKTILSSRSVRAFMINNAIEKVEIARVLQGKKMYKMTISFEEV